MLVIAMQVLYRGIAAALGERTPPLLYNSTDGRCDQLPGADTLPTRGYVVKARQVGDVGSTG